MNKRAASLGLVVGIALFLTSAGLLTLGVSAHLLSDLPVVQSANPSPFQLVADVILAILGMITAAATTFGAVSTIRLRTHVQELDVRVDGRMSDLLAATLAQGHGEGVAAERAQTQTREDIISATTKEPHGSQPTG